MVNFFKFFFEMVHTFGIFFLSFVGFVFASREWTYDNQSVWPGICLTGTKQSPIDIDSSNAINTVFSALNFTNYLEKSYATITNSGHTVQIVLINDNEENGPKVEEGGLPTVYYLHSVHFHWQAEHTIDGIRFPAEMHAVHYDKKYENLTEAQQHENGLAVFSVLFELSTDDDKYYNTLMDAIREVHNEEGKTVRTKVEFSADIFFPRDTSEFYRYMGSLTTPSCNEGVIWTVFNNRVPISQKQIAQFTSLWNRDGMLPKNYRNVQAVNDRKIYQKIGRISPFLGHERINSAGKAEKLNKNRIIFIVSLILIYSSL